MTPFVRHPNDAALTRWLETGEPDKVGLHVEACERCASRLEQLDRAGTGDRPRLDDALAAVLAAPVDLGERVLLGVERRSRSEQELTLLAGLFGLAVETGKLVVAPEPRTPRRGRVQDVSDTEGDNE